MTTSPRPLRRRKGFAAPFKPTKKQLAEARLRASLARVKKAISNNLGDPTGYTDYSD